MSHKLKKNDSRISPTNFWFLSLLCIAPLILQYKTANGYFNILHINLFLTTLIIFALINVRLRNECKRFLGRGHVTNRIKFDMSDILWRVLFPCGVASSLVSN